MKRFIFLLAIVLLALPLHAAEKKRYVIYAMLTESTGVTLADGPRWVMDKGDTFPVVMFKEQQTKIILQLAGTSFMVEASRAKIVQEKDLTEAQMDTYRHNVQQYLDNKAAKLKSEILPQ